MRKRTADPAFDPEEIEREDPVGEEAFEDEGFHDARGGGPDFNAAGLGDAADKRPGRLPQKLAGFPESAQHVQNSADAGRPDSTRVVIRERGGAGKGDPAVGGTRPD